MRRIFLAPAFAMTLSYFGCDADNSTANTALPNSPTNASPVKPQTMKIRLKVEDKVMTATLSDSETTRDFVSLLPLTLTMNDLFGREKFARLPRAISEEGRRTYTRDMCPPPSGEGSGTSGGYTVVSAGTNETVGSLES